MKRAYGGGRWAWPGEGGVCVRRGRQKVIKMCQP